MSKKSTGSAAGRSWVTKRLEIDGGKIVYDVPEHYELIKKVGSGAYGCVASFVNKKAVPVGKDAKAAEQKVAVKKITNAFADLIDGKRILREIKLLRHFKHENIVSILDIFPPGPVQTGQRQDSLDVDDIYIVTDLMETDLHRVIYSKQALTEEHAQYFIYQILRGLLYLHSCRVVHRDLKPANLLVNKNCDLKICDFGLARGFGVDDDDPTLTDYVVTRWYRAPEVVLAASAYSEKIDLWSVGCILYEILARKPLFTGKDHLDQIRRIVEKLGTPKEEDLRDWIPEKGPSRKFLKKCPPSEGRTMAELLPNCADSTRDFLGKLLTFDPTKRISVQESLEHPYIKDPDCNDEEPTGTVIDWKWDKFEPTKRILQQAIYNEARPFHPEECQLK